MRRKFILIPCILLTLAFQEGTNSREEFFRSSQIDYMQGEEFKNNGITGKGIRIAILDGGFPGANTHPALNHLFKRNQVVATWNFVKNNPDVYTGVGHGTSVLACVAGILDGKLLGLAPDAEFLLALTEQKGEPLSEELNWARAVDWAIDQGANIIQSSLGYTHQRYFTQDLDGKHSVSAKAAARAAKKGILIINSIGNEGRSRWQTLATPADADSIISVGAIDPVTGLVAGFSSVGPTADNRLKPNVCASGTVLTLTPAGGTRIVEGTSFSAPLITGFAACTWQMNPGLNAQEIMHLVEKSGHLYPYYDYVHGYGIPQASKILRPLAEYKKLNLNLSVDPSNFTIRIPRDELNKKSILPHPYLYYHISNHSGVLLRYGVYLLDGGNPVIISKTGFSKGDILRCSLNGESFTWQENE